MKTIQKAFLALALLAAHAPSQDQGNQGDTVLSDLARSTERDLEASVADLNALRERVAAEKLPIAQELTALEELVTRLRRDHDRLTRQVDSSVLDTAALKTEITARQDELDYVGTLLDDYARTLETKLSIGEMQVYGQDILTAKQAGENTTLSQAEKFAQQIPLVKVSLKRIEAAIGGMTFEGTAVDLLGAVAKGRFAIIGPVALFRAANGLAGLVVPQSGSDRPLVRPLEGSTQTGLSSLLATGTGLLPLDPSKGGALKALVQETNLLHVYEMGGPIMHPLLLCSIAALAVVLERLFFLFNERRRRDTKAQERLFTDVARGDLEGAVLHGRNSKDFVVRAMTYALENKESSLSHALTLAQSREMKRFKRGIPVLDTVITLAPLLGLLGTVTGMMVSFSVIGGELDSPGAITGGIAEALIATAFGLGIAIVCLLPFNYLNARMDEAEHEIDAASTQLKLMVEGPGTVAQTIIPAKSDRGRPELVGAGAR
jgi:biopolymer transport protein ExbB